MLPFVSSTGMTFESVILFSAKLVMDQATNKPKGFGFVKFASEEEAQKAIAEMNGKVKGMFIKYR